MSAWAKKLPKLKKRTLSAKQQQLHNFSLGSSGETQAIHFLEQHNYRIFATNIRVGKSEVDIVALDQNYDELVFIEVKTRSSNYSGNPSQAVDRSKIRNMHFVASNYMQRSNLDYDYRFDIIAVSPDGVKQYENITW